MLFLLTILSISQFSSAQNDSIFPNLNGSYCIETTTQDQWGNMYTEVEHFTIVSSPLINILSVIYQSDTIATLMLDGEKVLIQRTQYPFYPAYAGFDPSFGNGYEVLYDFGLNIGDTAYYPYGNAETVVSIDTFYIQGEVRKKLNLSNGEAWIQGMGSTMHPLTAKMYYFEVGYSLCYSTMEYIGNSPVDFVSYSGVCNCTGGINEPITNEPTLFPNPTNVDNLFITSDETIEEINIIDMNGRSFDTDFNSVNKTVNISNLNAGLYLVRIRTTSNLFTSKVQVTD